jgi:hypothetical protein
VTGNRAYQRAQQSCVRSDSYSTPPIEILHGRLERPRPTLRRVMHPEGRHITRITRHGWGRTVEVDRAVLRGLFGPRLKRALRCGAYGAREPDVSIRWECSLGDPAKPQDGIIKSGGRNYE